MIQIVYQFKDAYPGCSYMRNNCDDDGPPIIYMDEGQFQEYAANNAVRVIPISVYQSANHLFMPTDASPWEGKKALKTSQGDSISE